MSIPLPCRLSFGEKLQGVDCYADLFLYPGGHFLMNFTMRANAPFAGARINVGFALFDAAGNLLGGKTFGMEEHQASNIEPLERGNRAVRNDMIAWTMPPELLAQAARVAICFRPKGVAPDWDKLKKLAQVSIPLLGEAEDYAAQHTLN
jgi:hypothetical protein